MANFLTTSHEVLQRFPVKYMQYAFCYGSGAFKQSGSDMKSNVLDYIFVVNNSKGFHADNIKQNPKDYSFLKYLGSDAVYKVQGTGVYFNTLVPLENRTIKYGVVGSLDFKSDLLDWTTLYLSGRLHKPVHVIHSTHDAAIDAAIRTNLESAMHASLLLLPDYFTETQLFLTVASLSYSGDFRMTVGEDKNKVANIVTPNLHHFTQLYKEVLENEEHLLWNKESGTFEQVPNFATRFHHLNQLPWGILERLVIYRNKDGRSRDTEEVIRLLATDELNCAEVVSRSISDIVRSSSWNQTVKSALAAGGMKSFRYASAKLKKMVKSQMRSMFGSS